MVEFEENYDSVKSDFYKIVKSKLVGHEDKSLVISVIVDSLGNGFCCNVLRGITADVDSIGIDFMLKQKYKPCIVRGKSIEMRLTVFLLNRRHSPTKRQ
ncbi:MAG: hypothetical protein SCALA702_00260 [Melioribacteraceae bacterium]|nr:MAG: hypothetical protein SCALA702_00260 [Melioribacteraceae bacterium]